jgi:hypothetical protein
MRCLVCRGASFSSLQVRSPGSAPAASVSIRVLCYCSKETLVPESFCGEEMTCSNCQQRYVLPGRWRALGRPMLDLDLQPDEWVTIICECQNPMDVPVRYSGRRISCEECGAVHGVPEYGIPEANAAGQDVEAVRTSIELEAQRSPSQSDVRYPVDDGAATRGGGDGGTGSRDGVASRTGSGGRRPGARSAPAASMPEPEEYPADEDFEDRDDITDEELPFTSCKRCKSEFIETDPYCPECGAHPATGLTHPDAQAIWASYQHSGTNRRASSSNRSGVSRAKTTGTAARGKGGAGTATRGKARGGGAVGTRTTGKSGGALRRKTSAGGATAGKSPRPRTGGGTNGSSRSRSGSNNRPDRKRRSNGR